MGIKPFLRTLRYMLLNWSANWAAQIPSLNEQGMRIMRPGFIIGCGRSGTTILGDLLGNHPEVCYLREPYHLWAAVDRRTDVTNLHYSTDACFFMDDKHCRSETQVKFNRLICRFCRNASTVIEKTPHNIARIGFLEALSVDPLYIHIVRNGVDVARSIDRIATNNSYKMAGKSRSNQWWGRDECKWRTLACEGNKKGYFSDEVSLLHTHLQRGSYEWLVSLGEADRWRSRLGTRLFELTYTEFTSQPAKTLRQLCEFLEISRPQSWLGRAVAAVQPERPYSKSQPLELPPAMCERFNDYQSRYGFEGKAVPIST